MQLPHDFIQSERDCAVGAGNHRLLQTVGCLCSALVVVDNILGHPAQHIFIADYHFHTRHGGFTLGNIFRSSPFVRTESIVFLYLVGLLLIQENTCQAGIVFDGDGDTVILRFLHRILINDIAEHMNGLIDRCPGETDVCRVGQCVPKVFGESVCNPCPYLVSLAFGLDGKFGAEIILRAVSLVAQTNHIGTLRKQSGGLSKFLNRGDVDSTSFPGAHLFCQFLTGLKHFDGFVLKETFRAAEQFPALSFQVFPVNDDEDGGAAQLLSATKCQLAGEEQHRIGFAAACGSEIGTAFSIASY